MVGDFGVVENPFVRLHPILLEDFVGPRAVGRRAQGFQGLFYRFDVVFRQRARVRARIRDDFVMLV